MFRKRGETRPAEKKNQPPERKFNVLAEPIVYYVETCDNPDQDHHNHNSHNADGAQSVFHAFSANRNTGKFNLDVASTF